MQCLCAHGEAHRELIELPWQSLKKRVVRVYDCRLEIVIVTNPAEMLESHNKRERADNCVGSEKINDPKESTSA